MGAMHKIAGFIRNHLGAAIAAATAAVVLVGGLLILTLVGGGGSSSAAANASSSPSTTLAPSHKASGRGAAAKHAVRGQITALSATSWTVTTSKGAAVTVDLSSSTAFGTKAAPLTASNFAVGDQVVVSGTRTKSTITATRIAKAPAAAGATTPTTA
jgi:hypothetical protein